MLRHSLRVRLLLPVLALVLLATVAVTIVLATVEAGRVRREATSAIDRQTAALQSLLEVTRTVMLDRVHDGMRLLRRQGQALGAPRLGGPIALPGRTGPASDLLLGTTPQGDHFDLVDGVTDVVGGTATIFALSGNDFVRIATNVRRPDGSRAVGTVLDPGGPVIERIRHNESFYGVVDILGTPYVTGYEPIRPADGGGAIGIWYVGYKTDLAALDRVIGDSQVLDSGFIALFDSRGMLRFHSRTGATTRTQDIERIAATQPAGWVIRRQPVPGWGFSLVAAYPVSDVDHVIARQSAWIVGIGLLVCVLLLGLQSALIWTRVLKPVQHLTEVAEELSRGRWTHTITEVNLHDEIGTLAKAISRLANSVRLAMERLGKR
ncbi:MAG: Cache 3/Cache 2 fusion domain-containing protein [Xanthomonadaceae bacterium]|nr:Cache 3/Cache 2 fusion domain-containing protein [Xanthomonadaceae bacterium]MDE1963344.1 Cache 3/Cache 2 fusion domain-containing protein [Xanthomonadaceae bacterium]